VHNHQLLGEERMGISPQLRLALVLLCGMGALSLARPSTASAEKQHCNNATCTTNTECNYRQGLACHLGQDDPGGPVHCNLTYC
jgi:hypothetical protein